MEPTQGMSDEHFNALLEGKPITKEVETPRGKFVIKFPDGEDSLAIARREAELLDGINYDSLPFDSRIAFQTWATLDVLVLEGPPGWVPGNSRKFPDSSVLSKLYGDCLRLDREVKGVQRPSADERSDAGETGQPALDTEAAATTDNAKPRKLSGGFRRGKVPK